MRVFVTGATGFIGTAVVRELLEAGYRVLGLARSDAGAESLRRAGADVHHGEMERLESLTSGVKAADAVIHLAFNHDFSKFAENGEQERRALAAIGEAMVGSNKPLLVTAGTGMVASADGRATTEEDEPVTGERYPRTPEAAVRGFSTRGLSVGIVRLPQVHDTKKAGLISFVIAIARQQGYVAYVGDGTQCWPAAHVSDVARLYRLALEKPRPFARYHAVAEEGVTQRQIAEVIGRGLNLPVRSIPAEAAASYFGWLGSFVTRDLRASSLQTRHALGWDPTGPGLLEDLSQFEWVKSP